MVMTSRKYRSAWALTIIFLVLLVAPAITSFVLTLVGAPVAFSIISAEMFVTFCTLLWASYFGANVATKWVYNKEDKVLGDPMISESITDDDSGGQPPNSQNP